MRGRALALSLAVLVTLVACKGQTEATPAAPAPLTNDAATVTSAAPAQNSYADAVARVSPAVVTVRSERRARAAQQFPFFDDPRFREFFGDRLPRGQQPEAPRRAEGLGSGVIVSADGYILTNHHVVDGAEEITVELTDNRTFRAKLIGSDPPSDLAVLKIEQQGLPVLPLGDSDRVRVGDVALAVGNPLGIGQTVTMGIISAKGRATGLSDGSFEDFIQTDAPINRGNSGGALVNAGGELIGINSQILSPTGGNIGIGFAIPANMAKNVLDQLVKSGKVRRGYLGIGPQDVTADIAQSIGLRDVRGVIVRNVQPGSAAERAGLRRGDVITSLNGQPVLDSNSFRNRIAGTQPGGEVTLTVTRDGREQQLRATLAELPAEANAREREGGGQTPNNAQPSGRLGVTVEPLTPEQARQFELPANTQGLVVTAVDPEGPAADAGLRQGDVIEEANRQPVRSTEDLRAAIERSGTRPVLLLVNRRGNSVFITVTPRR
ncbi:MAG TPA: DegQ family serine endoprotease [Pyrinomonadaceae bacterium]|nr:DegQ family serine endoprotease [Pyrinomonadaceae bacterium]